MHHPRLPAPAVSTFSDRQQGNGHDITRPAAEPIPESRFTRTFHELHRLQNKAVPCIREGEAASESLATLTAEGLRGG